MSMEEINAEVKAARAECKRRASDPWYQYPGRRVVVARPHQLLEQVRTAPWLTLASSPVLLAELTHILSRAKFDSILVRTHTSRERALDEVRQLSALIDAPPLPRPVCRDPDDDAVLACAIAAEVDFIVSGGDLDLLVLKHYQHIPIVNPREALGLLDAAQK